MAEASEPDDADIVDACELDASDAAGFGEDWDVVLTMLPAQWEAKAAELGAVRRLRGFDSVGSLLRVLLIHLADGCSLRETAVRASAGCAGGGVGRGTAQAAARLRGVVRVDGARVGRGDVDAAGRACIAPPAAECG